MQLQLDGLTDALTLHDGIRPRLDRRRVSTRVEEAAARNGS